MVVAGSCPGVPRRGSGERLRICHMTAGDQWAGAEAQLLILVESLAAMGEFDLSAIVLNHGRLSAELRAVGIPVDVVEEQRFNPIQLVFRVRRILRDRKIAILHTHKRKENIIGGSAAHLAGVPCLVRTVHGLEDTHLTYADPRRGVSAVSAAARRWKNSLVNTLDGLITRVATHALIAITRDIAERLRNSHLRCENIAAVPNGIAWESVRAGDVAGTKRRMGLEPDTLIVGTAGRLVPIKGLDVFLEAARGIADQVPNVTFLIAGDGPLKGHVEERAREIGLGDKVLLTGFRTDIYDLLNIMDVFVMTSFYEGIPIVVLEAMALGKPLVLSDVGGHREILAGRGEKYLTAPGDPAAATRVCVELLRSEEERARAGLANRQIVMECFSEKRMAEQMSEVYKGVLAGAA